MTTPKCAWLTIYRQAEQQLGGAEPTRRAAALAGGFQAASYRALVEGLRERLRAAGGEAVEVYEAAYDEQVLSLTLTLTLALTLILTLTLTLTLTLALTLTLRRAGALASQRFHHRAPEGARAGAGGRLRARWAAGLRVARVWGILTIEFASRTDSRQQLFSSLLSCLPPAESVTTSLSVGALLLCLAEERSRSP